MSIQHEPAPPVRAGADTAAAHREPATAVEVWAAVRGEITGDEARSVIASYLAPGPQPRYDTPQARADAQADREAGG